MNKRSKSSIHLSTLKEKLADQTLELENIKSKVEKSKPILETIYRKVKLKESLYEKQLKMSKKQINESRQLAKQYKQLFENGVRIMQKSRFYERSKYEGNYLKNNEDKRLKNKSIYEQYQERVSKLKPEDQQENKNPEMRRLQQQTKELSEEMKSEIDKLRLIRSRSQKCMGKSKSTACLPRKPQRGEEQFKGTYLQKQREKLQQNL